MKIKTLFTITVIISVFYAVNLFFMPQQYLEMRGLKGEEAGILMTRLCGMIAIALISFAWFSRKMENPKDLRGMAIAFCLTFTSGTIVLLAGKLTITTMNSMGWADVAVSGLLTLSYAYFVFTAPKAA